MLKLLPEPLFTIPVPVPVPGEADALINCTFRWMDADAFDAWLQASAGQTGGKVYERDADSLIEILAGWGGVDAELSRDTLRDLFRARPKLAQSMVAAYAAELLKAPAKN